MAGYLVVLDSDIIDRPLLKEFRQQVKAALRAQGGRHPVRGGVAEVVEGDWLPDRMVALEFDAAEKAGQAPRSMPSSMRFASRL